MSFYCILLLSWCPKENNKWPLDTIEMPKRQKQDYRKKELRPLTWRRSSILLSQYILKRRGKHRCKEFPMPFLMHSEVGRISNQFYAGVYPCCHFHRLTRPFLFPVFMHHSQGLVLAGTTWTSMAGQEESLKDSGCPVNPPQLLLM